MGSNLVKITKFASPVYQAKFKSSTEQDVDCPGRTHYQEVPEDGIIRWLHENSISQLNNSIPGEHIGDIGYMIIGNDRTISVVHQNFRDAKKTEISLNLPESQKLDRFYVRNITIRSQPSEGNLPEALIQKLEEENYKKTTD